MTDRLIQFLLSFLLICGIILSAVMWFFACIYLFMWFLELWWF